MATAGTSTRVLVEGPAVLTHRSGPDSCRGPILPLPWDRMLITCDGYVPMRGVVARVGHLAGYAAECFAYGFVSGRARARQYRERGERANAWRLARPNGGCVPAPRAPAG